MLVQPGWSGGSLHDYSNVELMRLRQDAIIAGVKSHDLKSVHIDIKCAILSHTVRTTCHPGLHYMGCDGIHTIILLDTPSTNA